MVPAIVILAVGVSPTSALVLSQVVLSFGIPFAVVPLVLFTRRRDLMRGHVNRHLTTGFAVAVAAVITVFNVFLLYQQFAGT
jgi:manganese transport protein